MQFSADKIQIKYYVLQKDNAEVSYVGHHLVAQNQDCPVLPTQNTNWHLPTEVTQTMSNPEQVTCSDGLMLLIASQCYRPQIQTWKAAVCEPHCVSPRAGARTAPQPSPPLGSQNDPLMATWPQPPTASPAFQLPHHTPTKSRRTMLPVSQLLLLGIMRMGKRSSGGGKIFFF